MITLIQPTHRRISAITLSAKAKTHFVTLNFALLTCVLLLSGSGIARAATLPTGFAESVIASSITSPTAMAIAPDGRVFVCQQNGILRVIKNDTLLVTPFLTVTTEAVGERGLLGVTFDPNFANNQW